MTTEARVREICEEYGIKIIDCRSYPETRETRAVETMIAIYDAKGENHFRMVLVTVAETENNQGMIDKYLLLCVSDLIEEYSSIVEAQTSDWLDCFDKTPVAELQAIAKGHRNQRHLLRGMMIERISRRFGNGQGELFYEAAA